VVAYASMGCPPPFLIDGFFRGTESDVVGSKFKFFVADSIVDTHSEIIHYDGTTKQPNDRGPPVNEGRLKVLNNFPNMSKKLTQAQFQALSAKKRKALVQKALSKQGGGQQPRKKRNRRRNRSGKGSRSIDANKTQYKNRNVRRGNTTSNFGRSGIMKRLPAFTEQVSQPLSSQAWASFASYSINPGQKAIFPVGSVECQQWQKYRFRRFCVIYEPLVNEYNTNNDGAGEIIIGFDPDASDQAPTTFTQAINSKPIARGRPCDKIVLDVPVSLLHNNLDAHFVRHGSLPGGSDIKTYDVGLVNISVVGSGTTGTTTLGNIYFCYELDLMVQQIALNTAAPANNQVAWFQNTTAITLTTAAPLTSLLTLANSTVSTNGLSAVMAAAGDITLPTGNYIIDYWANFHDTANEGVIYAIQPQRNGVSMIVGTLNLHKTDAATAGSVTDASLAGSVFFSSDGVLPFTLKGQATGAAGTLTATGSVRITAV